MNCCCDSRIDAVGQFGGFAGFSALPGTLTQLGAKTISTSSFWTSGFGQLLSNVIIPGAVTIGGAFAVKALTGDNNSGGGGGQAVGPWLSPAGIAAGAVSPQTAQAPMFVQAPAASATPQWVLPAAILGGALVLALALRK